MIENDFDNEPPLLEDLGIEPKKVLSKLLAVLTQRGLSDVADYDDMTGPILIFLLFNSILMLVSLTSSLICMF